MVQAWSVDARVCIIGAGAAGLTSALALKERGYRNITVIEREPSVGGKCYSHATGDNLLELGANIVFPGSIVHGLAQRTGARLVEWFPIQVFDFRTGHERPFGSTESHFSLSERVRAYAKLAAEMLRNHRIRAHGFHACADVAELGTPVRQWLKDRNLAVIEEMAMPFMVGAGLGYPEDDVPVVYFLKMLQFIQGMGISDLLHRRTYRFEHGYQDLWKRVASQLFSGIKLLLGTEVEHVERPLDAPIALRTQAGDIACDALIVTAPDRAQSLLDARGAERDLLSRFRLHTEESCILMTRL
jgi:predicted NAD/FAD-binding protein